MAISFVDDAYAPIRECPVQIGRITYTESERREHLNRRYYWLPEPERVKITRTVECSHMEGLSEVEFLSALIVAIEDRIERVKEAQAKVI